MKKLLFVCAIIGVMDTTHAQYIADVARFSQTGFGGTARVMGIAGAQTAIGGDIGNLSGNPAGIGFYRSSDFSISPTLNFNSSKTNYLGNNTPGSKDNLSLGSLGVVFAQANKEYNGNDRTEGWVSAGLGIGFNKINTFTTQYTASGFNKANSITQYFADNANVYIDTNDVNNFQYATYNAYLINYSNGRYIPSVTANTQQTDKSTLTGGQNEWVLNFGANYSNKFYIGAGLGFTGVNYNLDSRYSENGFVDQGGNGLRSLGLTEKRNVSGTGYNAKIGAIIRPIDFIRIGATIQTPTYYVLSEISDQSLSSKFDNGSSYSQSFHYEFDYTLKTAYRYNLGAAIFIGKYGFITADVEQVDHGLASYSSDDLENFDSDKNTEIRSTYTNVTNYRVGAEARLGTISIRGGYAYYGNPSGYGSGRISYTGGLGYKINGYYIDLAVVNTQYTTDYSPYPLLNGSSPTGIIKYNRNQAVLTFGLRF